MLNRGKLKRAPSLFGHLGEYRDIPPRKFRYYKVTFGLAVYDAMYLYRKLNFWLCKEILPPLSIKAQNY